MEKSMVLSLFSEKPELCSAKLASVAGVERKRTVVGAHQGLVSHGARGGHDLI